MDMLTALPLESQPQTHYLSVYQVYHPDFKDLELYGGEYPGSFIEAITEHNHKVGELIELQITTTLCLMKDFELAYFSAYEAAVTQVNPTFKKILYPIADMSIPDTATMVHILDKIDQLIADQEKIYVHCWGGHGRTGTVIGCWLKRHGFENRIIYQKLMLWRMQTLFGTTSSPQAHEQFMMINHWQPGE